MKIRRDGPVLIGAVMVAFLTLVVLVTKGFVSALEMLGIGALVILAAVWYDSL